MEFFHSVEVVSLERKCLGHIMDLNMNHHSIIFRILWGTNHVDRRKLCVTIQCFVSPGSRGFLKSCLISVGHERATDILAEAMNISALILDGERDSSTEGPLQKSIIFSLHYANKKANVSSISAINASWEDTHEELVSMQASVNRRTVK